MNYSILVSGLLLISLVGGYLWLIYLPQNPQAPLLVLQWFRENQAYLYILGTATIVVLAFQFLQKGVSLTVSRPEDPFKALETLRKSKVGFHNQLFDALQEDGNYVLRGVVPKDDFKITGHYLFRFDCVREPNYSLGLGANVCLALYSSREVIREMVARGASAYAFHGPWHDLHQWTRSRKSGNIALEATGYPTEREQELAILAENPERPIELKTENKPGVQ